MLFQKNDLNASYYRVYDVQLNFYSQGVVLHSNVPRSGGCFVSPVHIVLFSSLTRTIDLRKKKTSGASNYFIPVYLERRLADF